MMTHFYGDIHYRLKSCCFQSLILAFVFTSLIFNSDDLIGQNNIAIVRAYGGVLDDEATQIVQCQEGGYLVVGTTGSDSENASNFYLIRIDDDLGCIWTKSFGGLNVDRGLSVVENENQEIIVAGYTNSFGAGGYDVLVYKLDPNGLLIWQKTFGGDDWDFATKVVKHPVNGYLVCGKTYSASSELSQGLVIHFDENGQEISSWTFSSELNEEIVDIDFYSDTIIISGNRYNDENSIGLGVVRYTNFEGEQLFEFTVGSQNQFTWINNSLIYEDRYYSTGYLLNEGVKNSFVSATDLDGVIYFGDFQVFQQEEVYSDIVMRDGSVLTAGRSNVVGYGALDAIVYSRSSDGWFNGAFFYGTSSDEGFNSIIVNSNNQLVLAGYRLVNQTQKDFLVMKYLSPTLTSENIMAPVFSDCFLVAVEQIQPTKGLIESKIYYNLNGQKLKECLAEEKIILPSGMYIVVSVDSSGTKYYSKEIR